MGHRCQFDCPSRVGHVGGSDQLVCAEFATESHAADHDGMEVFDLDGLARSGQQLGLPARYATDRKFADGRRSGGDPIAGVCRTLAQRGASHPDGRPLLSQCRVSASDGGCDVWKTAAMQESPRLLSSRSCAFGQAGSPTQRWRPLCVSRREDAWHRFLPQWEPRLPCPNRAGNRRTSHRNAGHSCQALSSGQKA